MADVTKQKDVVTQRRIPIEIGTPLQLEIGEIRDRLKSALVGMELDQYLILRTPGALSSMTARPDLLPGIPVIVRYLYEGTVFGFESGLIKAIATPRRLLFVEYPRKTEIHDLRAHKRVDCLLPASSAGRGGETAGTVLDLSGRGCRYVAKATQDRPLPPFQIGDKLDLRLQFPGIAEDQGVSGVIRNMNKDISQTSLGIQFKDMRSPVRKLIADFISRAEEIVSPPSD